MVDLGRHVGWTERERELIMEVINAINEGHHSPLRRASEVVRMSYQTGRNTLWRVRNRYEKMRDAIDEYSKWRRQIKGRRYL